MQNIPVPKEHGSWVMLIVPLAIGTAVAQTWRMPLWILLAAALGFYLMRSPLATLVKTRKRPSPAQSVLWRWTIIYGAVALLAGTTLIVEYHYWWLVPIGAFGVVLVVYHLWLVSRRKEMSLPGELSGIIGLAMGAPMAYYVATGRLDRIGWALWLINALYFGGTVFYVKLKVRQQPKLSPPPEIAVRLRVAAPCLTYHTLALAVAIALTMLSIAPHFLPWAFLPVFVKVWVGAWQWQDRRSLNLKRLGLVELAYSIVFALVTVAAFLI